MEHKKRLPIAMIPETGRSGFHVVADYEPAGDQPQAIAALAASLEAGTSHQTLLGVTGSGKTYTMAHVIARLDRPALVLAPNKTLAAQLYGELRGFFPENAVEYFVSYYDYYQPEAYVPHSDTYIAKDASINQHIEQLRLSATKSLLERRDVVIVASVSAIYGLGDPESYLQMMLHLARGTRADPTGIARRLVELQYQRTSMDLARGSFRVAGDVIDVFPAESQDEAVRITLFDEEVETLAWFDPLTGRKLRDVPRVTIYPKTHYATPRERINAAVEHIQAELAERLAELHAAGRLVEAQRLEERTRFDMEIMLETGSCPGIENYSRHLSGRAPGEPPPTLFDYLPDDALVFVDESHVTIPQLAGMFRGDRARKETLVHYGFRLPSALDNRPLRFEEFQERASQVVYVSATPGPYELSRSLNVVELVVRPTGLVDPELEVRPASHQVQDLLSQINERVAMGTRVLVTTLTKRMAEDLTDYLDEHGIRVRYMHSDVDAVERVEILRDLRLGAFDVLVGINLLREGLDLPEVSLVAILDADKEGFLRSERSLIQTIGRAARHLQGKAILYADTITPSMTRAIEETERRRHKQMAFNEAHGIIPRGITKAVPDLLGEAMVGMLAMENEAASELAAHGAVQPATQQQALAVSAQIERAMRQAASELRFEEAARLRDALRRLQQHALQLPSAEGTAPRQETLPKKRKRTYNKGFSGA